VASPIAEAITASFYAWELRGRGWAVAPYPVILEPPFRRCFLLPEHDVTKVRIDDGKRPTLLSSLVDGIRDSFTPQAPQTDAVTAFEEPAPYQIPDFPDIVTLRVYTPEGFSSDMERTRRFFSNLTGLESPLSFELVGHDGRVTLQVAVDAGDMERVRDLLTGYFPEAVIVEGEDALLSAARRDDEAFFVDFGLEHEFFLPLGAFKSFSLDPYIPLIPALARAARDEVLAFQVLLTPVLNPWDRAIMGALVPQGEPIFQDAPEFVPLAKEKVSSPLFAAVIRLGALAATRERARDLVRGTGSFFTQFERPGANSFIPLVNEDYPDDQHAAGFVLRTSRRSGMLVSAAELAGVVHLPDASIRHPALVRLDKRTKLLPEAARGHELVLGVNEHHGGVTPVTLDSPTRLRHMHVIGASGTGKSTLLLNLIAQDIASGEGVAVLDPHGDLIDAVLARIPQVRYRDVILFDPSDEVAPVGINLLQAQTPVEKTLLSSDLVSIFRRFATSWGDGMSTVLGNAVLALLESSGATTLLDLRRFLVDEAFRKNFLSKIPDPEVQFFWRQEYPLIGARALGPILTRLNTFLRPKLVRNVIAQRNPRVTLEAAVNGRKIFLAKLSQGLIGRENAHLLGSLIVTKFHQVALARQSIATAVRAPFFLYMDEFQHFVTPSVDSLLTEARKYSIGLTLAHQTLHQLRDVPTVEAAVTGNAHTRVIFRVGDDDARKLADGLSHFESKDLSNLKQGEAIVRLGLSGSDFNLRVLSPKAALSPDESVSSIRDCSRQQFGMAADALAKELADSYGAVTPFAQERNEPTRAESLQSEVTERTADVRPPSVTPTEEGLVQRRRHAPTPATEKTEGRGGKDHKYLQHLVKRLAEERGFRATIEQPIPGGAGHVDIALVRHDRRIAVEVSVSTGREWEAKKITRYLEAGFHQFVLLTKTERLALSLKKHVTDTVAITDLSRVQIISADHIVEYLDQFETKHEESVVRGYRVKVKRQSIVPEDASRRRSDIANVIAQSVKKSQEK
jgi:hypothetical protein